MDFQAEVGTWLAAHIWTLLLTSPNRPGCDSIRLLMADGDHDDERAWFRGGSGNLNGGYEWNFRLNAA